MPQAYRNGAKSRPKIDRVHQASDAYFAGLGKTVIGLVSFAKAHHGKPDTTYVSNNQTQPQIGNVSHYQVAKGVKYQWYGKQVAIGHSPKPPRRQKLLLRPWNF